MRTILIFVSLIYIFAMQTVMEGIACTGGDVPTLRASPKIKCDGKDNLLIAVSAAFLLLFYGVGFPLLMARMALTDEESFLARRGCRRPLSPCSAVAAHSVTCCRGCYCCATIQR